MWLYLYYLGSNGQQSIGDIGKDLGWKSDVSDIFNIGQIFCSFVTIVSDTLLPIAPDVVQTYLGKVPMKCAFTPFLRKTIFHVCKKHPPKNHQNWGKNGGDFW